MQNKIILVTGATSGIGNSIVRLFHERGAVLVAVGRSQEKLQALASDLGERTWTYAADLVELENIRKLFDFCRENSLKLDGIVHCAGVTLNCPLRANDITETEQLMRINVEALMELCHFASSRRYVNKGASIVALSSMASLCGVRGLAAYSASKAAVNSLVKSAALELSPWQIRVNAIAPAMVRTQMYYDTIAQIPDMEASVQANQPFGLIEPESIAEIADFLMSDKAKYITGSILVVSAGNVI